VQADRRRDPSTPRFPTRASWPTTRALRRSRLSTTPVTSSDPGGGRRLGDPTSTTRTSARRRDPSGPAEYVRDAGRLRRGVPHVGLHAGRSPQDRSSGRWSSEIVRDRSRSPRVRKTAVAPAAPAAQASAVGRAQPPDRSSLPSWAWR
jgi:hypothetical protein